jgi:hypothetical protein
MAGARKAAGKAAGKAAAGKRSAADARPSPVDAYLAALDHPHAAAVATLRKLILSIDARIREDVKWNAPSFALDDHFATFRLHPAPNFQLILHAGATARKPPQKFDLPDANGWVKWAAPDRAIVALPTSIGAAEQRALKALLKRWIDQL